jgi:hypothetical protein
MRFGRTGTAKDGIHSAAGGQNCSTTSIILGDDRMMKVLPQHNLAAAARLRFGSIGFFQEQLRCPKPWERVTAFDRISSNADNPDEWLLSNQS